jgi:hypothetical protein
MTDVFISYKKEDAARVEPIARGLSQAGYEVWWDHNIPPGQNYRDVIGAALSTAKCVMVVWSNLSASAQWVLDEADEGKKRNVLLPVMIDEVEIPYGFRQIEAARLIGWGGDAAAPEWSKLLGAVAHFVGRAPGGPPKPFATPSALKSTPKAAAAERKSGVGAGPLFGVLAAVLALGGGGYAAWQAGLIGAPNTPVDTTGVDTYEGDPPGEASAPAGAAGNPMRGPVSQIAGDPMATFFASGYVYCDAKLVGELWKSKDIGQNKINAGEKILAGNVAGLETALQAARAAGHRCDWQDSGYSFVDMEKLAGIWGMKDAWDAKVKVGELFTNGEGLEVKRALGF